MKMSIAFLNLYKVFIPHLQVVWQNMWLPEEETTSRMQVTLIDMQFHRPSARKTQ